MSVPAWRRAVDIFLGLLVAVSSVQAALEGPRLLAADRFASWQSVVACGQMLLFITGAGGLFALWRSHRWALPLLTGWAVGTLIAAGVASFAWSGFIWSGFLMAVVGTLALDLVVLWWATTVFRRRRPLVTDGA